MLEAACKQAGSAVDGDLERDEAGPEDDKLQGDVSGVRVDKLGQERDAEQRHLRVEQVCEQRAPVDVFA